MGQPLTIWNGRHSLEINITLLTTSVAIFFAIDEADHIYTLRDIGEIYALLITMLDILQSPH